MCLQSVFVLVFMCCVISRAQGDPNNSPEYTQEHPSMLPDGKPLLSGTIPGFSNTPENPDRHLQIMTALNGYSDDSYYLQSQGMLPQHNPSSGLSDDPENPDIYPQETAPQYDPSSRFPDSPNNPYMHHDHRQRRPPPYGPSPGISDETVNTDMHPQGMSPQYDPSHKFPYLPNDPYIYPQGRPPQYDSSSGYLDNSDNPHLQPQGRPPPHGSSAGASNVPENPHINPQEIPPHYRPSPGIPDIREHSDMHPHKMPPPFGPMLDYADDPDPPDLPHRQAPVQHAGLPRKLEVFPLPLENSDHELKFNVSWVPSMGGVANGYSLEVWSLTETVDCQPLNSPINLPMCYEYNIAGNVTWSLIPALSSTVAETCAIRPGCAYNVKLMSHPWDGHTTANLLVELDECVVGVCSCAHWPRLPAPVVSAQSVTIKGKVNSNISWTLPTPSYPQRLPSAKLGKQGYIVSLGKQMVTDAISTPWFANVMTANVDADGFVSDGDTVHSILFPISQQMELKVKLLARVKLVDERGCVGPAGNATVFDPEEVSKSKFSFGVYAILGALIGAWAMGAVFVLSARVVKRVLNSLRPAPVSAPLEPLRRRPAWFPLQLRT